MNKKNNEINIKINLSDDLLSAIANAFLLAKMPNQIRGLIQTRPSTEIPPYPMPILSALLLSSTPALSPL